MSVQVTEAGNYFYLLLIIDYLAIKLYFYIYRNGYIEMDIEKFYIYRYRTIPYL